MNIQFENVWFAYEDFGGFPPNSPPSLRKKESKKFQLESLNFEIREQEFVGIAGRSGSGKTTLMQLFTGLLIPDRGRILIDEVDINNPKYDLTALRRRIGLVFQFPEMQIFAATVFEELAFGPRQQRLSQEEIARRVTESLHQVDLDDSYLSRNPLTLSQGEKRRVALAGVLAMRPEILVLDEPTASLDARGTAEVRSLLRLWHEEGGKTIITVTHDLDLIASLCQRLMIMERGRLLYDGPVHSILEADNRGILRQAGLPLPRSERLRQHLAKKGLAWESVSILKEGRHHKK